MGIAAALAAISVYTSAGPITGTVTNKTTNKPSAGDEVVLIDMSQGMSEAAQAKTDSKGHFTLEGTIADPQMALVRVTHQGTTYYSHMQQGGAPIAVDVFDSAPKVDGISTAANVMRIETDPDGRNLHVIENFFVTNPSAPPRTQAGEHAFQFYLPQGAVVEGAAATFSSGVPLQTMPTPMGDANHFAFSYPIRPGNTMFQVAYTLPYSGSLKFTPRMANPTDTLAVMLPKSMTFKAEASSPFTQIPDDPSFQTIAARNITASQPLEFTVSGTGQLPRSQSAASGDNNGDTAMSGDARPGGGLGNPLDPGGANDPWAKYKLWILGGLGLVMALAGIGVAFKGGSGPRPAVAAASGSGALIASLKEELFAMESDRVQGKIGEAEYAEQKAALEKVIRRAVSRNE